MAQNYAVGRRTFTYTDPARSNRSVTGEMFYPATSAGSNTTALSGQYPLIVFGHGFTMNYTEYQVWWDSLVPKGYVMVFPSTESGFSPNHETFAQDMSFLLNYFNTQSQTNSAYPLYQRLSGKSGFMGHSMGGGCSYRAMMINPNAITDVALAPANINTSPNSITSAQGITTRCVLTIAGTKDCVVQSGGAPIDMYNGLASPYKAFLNITNGSHCQFGIASAGSFCTLGELCSGFMAKSAQHIEMVKSARPWLDYWLKGECPRWTAFQNHLHDVTNYPHTYQESGALPAAPTPTFTASTTQICAGQAAVLTGTITAPYCSYEWKLNGAATTFGQQNIIAATQAGTYTLVAYNAAGVAAISSPITISVNPSPTVSAASVSVCTGAPINMSANGATTYAWSGPAAFSANTSAITPSVAGTYNVTGTGANGCTASASAVLTINTTPTLVAPDVVACTGSAGTLNVSGADTYTWSGPNGFTATGASASATTAGTYTVTGTSAIGSCTATASLNMTVQNAPNLTTVGASVCSGATATISANGADTYTWSGPNNYTATGASVTITESGTYTVTGSLNGGCSATANVVVAGQAIPNLFVSGNTTICQFTNASLSVSGADTYVWSGPSGFTATGDTANPSAAGNYSITGTAANGCTVVETLTITHLPAPQVSANDASVCPGFNATLTASGGQAYAWSGPNGFTATGATAAVSTAGTYTVVGTGVNGCSATATSTLTVFPAPTASFSATGALLTASAGSSFQWYLDGVIINGATSNTYTATQTGVYAVQIMDANGCTATSASQNIVISAIDMLEILGVKFFPNPVEHQLQVLATDKITVKITAMNGQLMLERELTGNATLDLGILETGVYTISVQTATGEGVGRLMKL